MSSRTKKIIMWTIVVLLTLQFLAAGVGKLTGGWDPMFEEWGYTPAFALVIGLVEVLLVVGLFISRLRLYSVIIILLVMTGAIYTHIAAQEYGRIIHNLIIMLLAGGLYQVGKKLEVRG